jgi:hypothetical protein
MNVFISRTMRLGLPRPVTTPTAVTLLAAGALLILALLLPDHAVERASAAAEVQPISVTPVRPHQTVSLRDRLVVGLKARLKSEVDFVELIALRVQTGHLPQRLVDETFFWARQRASVRRPGRSRRPILFFQPAMKLRAQRLGIEL